jgi:anthranilate phosphoribosyltransferase
VIKEAISLAVAQRELDEPTMSGAIETILRGEATAAQMSALLVALRIKGESVAELAAAARVMRKHAVLVPVTSRGVLVDTCGTGGDGAETFNISTAAAVVAAAAGVRVAKHGNRKASSKAGSADVLEALGVRIELSAAQVARCVDELGIGFAFARTHHPAMRHVGTVRSEIGVRTLFNYLGPLSNPAGASHQVVGVPEPRLLETMARVLGLLGGTRAWVVHGHGGLDELALSGPTQVAELEAGQVSLRQVHPEDFGLRTQHDADLKGGDAIDNAVLIRRVFQGERSPKRDVVVLNAAAALYVARAASSLPEAARLAGDAIDSGAAARKLDAWVALSQVA